jgi:uncharacterized membrane protein YhaH (DUF805 family)/cold shock CspA family protein
MRGEVLHYDEAQGFGFIAGVDGNRYTFAREDLRRAATVARGTQVEFAESGSQARGVFPAGDEEDSAATAPQPRQATHFGRAPAVAERMAGTGLWDYFRAAITTNYFNFRGRARRKEYWGFALFGILAFAGLALAGMALDDAMGNMDSPSGPFVTIVLLGLFVLAMIVPSISMTVRRIHDLGLSGWFYLLVLLPYVGGAILFVFGLIPSQTRENRWGPVPAGIKIPPPYVPATASARKSESIFGKHDA